MYILKRLLCRQMVNVFNEATAEDQLIHRKHDTKGIFDF